MERRKRAYLSDSKSRFSWKKTAVFAVPIAAAAVLALAILTPETKNIKATSVAEKTVIKDEIIKPQIPVISTKQKNEIIGSAEILSGLATYVRNNESPVPVSNNTKLKDGDVLSLINDAKVKITFNRLASLILSKEAVVKLDLSEKGAVLTQRRGRLAARVTKLSNDDMFIVNTPAGQVEVKGTIFEVNISASAQARVDVAEGTVMVRDHADERNVVLVDAGYKMVFDWSKPNVVPIGKSSEIRILKLFGIEQKLVKKQRGKIDREKTSTTVKVSDDFIIEELFFEAQKLRSARQMPQAIAVYKKIVKRAPGKNKRAEAIFAMGQMKYLSGNLKGADKDLSENLTMFKGTPYHEMALYYVARSRIKMGNCKGAVKAINQLILIAPNHKLTDKARTLREKCMQVSF